MEWQGTWPAGSSPPGPALKLLEYAERNQGLVVGDFRAGPSLQPELLRLFQGDRKMARAFAIFGTDGSSALYGFWFHGGVAPEHAPVVCLQSDGCDNTVLAGGIEPFLSLLASGRNRIGAFHEWGAGSARDEVRGLKAFRAWLQDELHLSPAGDPAALVRQARAAHPDLEALIARWAEENATLEGPSPDGWLPYRPK